MISHEVHILTLEKFEVMRGTNHDFTESGAVPSHHGQPLSCCLFNFRSTFYGSLHLANKRYST